jgi:hypothetical protein
LGKTSSNRTIFRRRKKSERRKRDFQTQSFKNAHPNSQMSKVCYEWREDCRELNNAKYPEGFPEMPKEFTIYDFS